MLIGHFLLFLSSKAISHVQNLYRQTLTRQTEDGISVTIMSISLTAPEPETKTPTNASVNLPSSSVSEPQDVCTIWSISRID